MMALPQSFPFAQNQVHGLSLPMIAPGPPAPVTAQPWAGAPWQLLSQPQLQEVLFAHGQAWVPAAFAASQFGNVPPPPAAGATEALHSPLLRRFASLGPLAPLCLP